MLYENEQKTRETNESREGVVVRWYICSAVPGTRAQQEKRHPKNKNNEKKKKMMKKNTKEIFDGVGTNDASIKKTYYYTRTCWE